MRVMEKNVIWQRVLKMRLALQNVSVMKVLKDSLILILLQEHGQVNVHLLIHVMT